MATITEDLVLLLLDPGSGRAIVDSTSLDRAVGGALLLDLSTRDRLTADETGARAWLTVADSSTTGDPLLDTALARLEGRHPLRAQKAVERLARKTREPVLQRLVERGLVRRDRGRILGVFPVTTWPAADAGPVTELRRRIAEVLRDGAPPDQHTALLISLVHAVKAEHKLVDGPRRQLRARADQVAQGDWAGPAVRKAVQAVQTSVAVAVAASASAAGASGSS
ncbi:GOLPH3/VPS74 family protein [Pseudonocardia xinjiangensis]|uniref:GOLPH3/VPS74 family protein n=1 Tax=Pseudonocardia xinjiangensis TaxID=75289 RepID=UPI003D8F29C7